MKNSKFSYSPEELEINKVIKHQQNGLCGVNRSISTNINILNQRACESEELLSSLGYKLPVPTEGSISNDNILPVTVTNWSCILENAVAEDDNLIILEDIFSPDEIRENAACINALRKEFYTINKLDKWDFAMAGIAGTIAALIDYFLVTKVNFQTGSVSPSSMKSGVEKLWDTILPPETVKALEKKFKVPFDISTNTSRISQEVLGLNPKTHRFQSLGHDPLLGFVFGIKDLMSGELTAIDGNGRFIVQSVHGACSMDLISAIVTEFGHLLSDVNATSKTGMKLSIPAPLLPLLQIVQCGSISYNGKAYSISDLVKRMYYDGYNFNHFIGMSVPVFVTEIVIRLYSVLKNIFHEHVIESTHKNDIMLFVANSILCAENIGKVVVTQNPFSINYVSWISTAKYTARAMKYVLLDYKIEQLEYVQTKLDQETTELYTDLNRTWEEFLGGRSTIELT